MCSEYGEGSDVDSATMLASSLWAVPIPFGLIWHSLMMVRSRRAVEAAIIAPVKKSTHVEHLRPHGFTYTWLVCETHSPYVIGGRQEACPKPQILELLVQYILFLIHNPLNKNNNLYSNLCSVPGSATNTLQGLTHLIIPKTPWDTFEAQISESWPWRHRFDLSLSSATHSPKFPSQPFLSGCRWCVPSILYH